MIKHYCDWYLGQILWEIMAHDLHYRICCFLQTLLPISWYCCTFLVANEAQSQNSCVHVRLFINESWFLLIWYLKWKVNYATLMYRPDTSHILKQQLKESWGGVAIDPICIWCISWYFSPLFWIRIIFLFFGPLTNLGILYHANYLDRCSILRAWTLYNIRVPWV